MRKPKYWWILRGKYDLLAQLGLLLMVYAYLKHLLKVLVFQNARDEQRWASIHPKSRLILSLDVDNAIDYLLGV